MSISGEVYLPIKRLSTKSQADLPGYSVATKWCWYWKNEHGNFVKYQFERVSANPTHMHGNHDCGSSADNIKQFFHLPSLTYLLVFAAALFKFLAYRLRRLLGTLINSRAALKLMNIGKISGES